MDFTFSKYVKNGWRDQYVIRGGHLLLAAFLVVSTYCFLPNWGVTILLALLLQITPLAVLCCLLAFSLTWASVVAASMHGLLHLPAPPGYALSLAQAAILTAYLWPQARKVLFGKKHVAVTPAFWRGPVRVSLTLIATALLISGLFRSFPFTNLLWGLIGLMYTRYLRVQGNSASYLLLTRRVMLAALMGLATCVLVEAGARLILPDDIVPVDFYVPCIDDQDLLFRLKPGAQGAFVLKDNSGKLTRVEARVSSQGIRDREFPPKQPGEFRIVLLGDSYTMGQGLTPEETYARQLEALMNREELPLSVSVVNCGMGGYAPWQERIFLQKFGFEFEPDIVLLQLFPPNDVIACYTRSGKMLPVIHEGWEQRLYDMRRRHEFPIRAEHWTRAHFLSYRMALSASGKSGLVKRAIYGCRFYPSTDYQMIRSTSPRSAFKEICLANWYPELQEAWNLYADCIRGMQEDCKNRGVQFAAFVHGDVSSLKPEAWTELNETFPDTPYEMNKDIRLTQELFESLNIPYADVFSTLKNYPHPDDLYFRHDGHFSPRGAKLVAECLRDFLLSHYLKGE